MNQRALKRQTVQLELRLILLVQYHEVLFKIVKSVIELNVNEQGWKM